MKKTSKRLTFRPRREKPLKCSFCGRSERDASRLIVAGEAAICNKCVWECARLVMDDTNSLLDQFDKARTEFQTAAKKLAEQEDR